jgi:AI2M/AI1M-like, HNH endonuclease
MPGNRRLCPDVRSSASRDSRDTVKATLPEPQSPDDANIHPLERRLKKLVQRLLADRYELCGSGNQVEVRHIRALKDLNHGTEATTRMATRMAVRRRKTLVVCRVCHESIHTADARQNIHDKHWRAGCCGKRARPVREEVVGKGTPNQSHLADDLLHRTSGVGREALRLYPRHSREEHGGSVPGSTGLPRRPELGADVIAEKARRANSCQSIEVRRSQQERAKQPSRRITNQR